MRPSPFPNRIKRREIKIQKHNEKHQDIITDSFKQTQQNNPKIQKTTNIFKKSKSKDKNKINQQNQSQKQQKTITSSSSYRPNMKIKSSNFAKKLKIFNSDPKKDNDNQSTQQQYPPSIKTNINKKNQHHIKQDVIIAQPSKNQLHDQQSIEASNNSSYSMSLAPKYRIKSKHESQFPIIQEEPKQQSVTNNMQQIKIQNQQINLTKTNQKISGEKLEKQQIRVNQLRNLLNLQHDLFQQTLNISSITSYQIYINKIKNSILKNSNDQTLDQKFHQSTQTIPLQFQNFINQSPQDYYHDINSIIQQNHQQLLQNFIQKIAPVLEELIKPSSAVVMPPIFLLALKPEFKKMLACPFPLFVYHSETLGLGIVAIGQKLYITDSEIETVLSLNNNLIAGSKQGTIYLWSGKNDGRSRLYRKILQYTDSTNFELPECSSQDLDRFSVYRSNDKIVSLLAESANEFNSLDSSCKMIKWRIERSSNNKVTLKPQASYQFMNIIQRPNLIGYELKKRNENSAGILVWNGDQLIQRLYTQGFKVNCLTLPHRTHLVYTACEDGSIRIYEEHYSTELYKLHLSDSNQLIDVIVPETEYDNKKLSVTSNVFVCTSKGCIYSINLLSNGSEAKPMISWGGDRKERDIIFKGVNKLPKGFELVSVYRDLKCTIQQKKINVNLDSTIQNIKNILQENRKVNTWLESLNSLIIVQ